MMRQQKERGVVIVWVVLIMMLLIGFIGLGIDLGLATLVANQLQNAADAAALAGARTIRTDEAQARIDAQRVAEANKVIRQPLHLNLNTGNDPAGDIVVGYFDRDTQTFTPQTTNINAIQVVARRDAGSLDGPVPLAFGPSFGVSTFQAQRQAIAMTGGKTGAGLLVLSPDDPRALYVRGSAIVRVNNGDIQVNSSASNAADLQGSKFIVDAPNLNVVGDIAMDGGDIGDTNINTNARVVDDPLAAIPEPTWDAASDLGERKISTGSATLSPGYYSGGFSFSGGTIALEPGIYILGGVGLDIRGGTNLTGNGVMFFLDGGCASINGTGNIVLTPPDPLNYNYPDASTYEGLLIFQSRDNTTPNTINGTAGLDLTGSLYFPSAHVTLSGTSDKMGTQFVAHTLEIAGNSNLTINYDGKFPAPGNRIYLVH